ncbi:hypothetical protein E2C01_033377 [Portunus trituberculatus]|uniref:Uncharacterized protein n=1 Tax=Portunus trituberculatus TaxID=210409 RepID=A0A5B7F3W6_PORTR|nr:hypothetical protein [Portunus trituberculatus]
MVVNNSKTKVFFVTNGEDGDAEPIRVEGLHKYFTRFRTCGHSLAVETGRWNRRGRGRLPVEERLCIHGQIQTGKHVVEDCPLTENTRQVYNISRLEDLFNDNISSQEARAIIHEILEIFK